MNGEKSKDKLMKQGRGLAKLSVCLIILAFILIIVLLDQSFVPRNAEWWEYMKTGIEGSFLIKDYDEREKEHTDEELWEITKNAMVEYEIVPFKSGFLCWAFIQWNWGAEKERINAEKAAEAQRQEQINAEKAEEAYWQEQISLSQKNAETAMLVFSNFLSEKGIYTDSVISIDCYLHNQRINLICFDAFGEAVEFLSEEEQEELKSWLLDVFPDTKEAAVKMYLLEQKCTAAVFSPDVDSVVEGVDFPYLDENGHFDREQQYGYGWSQVHENNFIIGYVDEMD